jgi:hypothetical protein
MKDRAGVEDEGGLSDLSFDDVQQMIDEDENE